MTDAPSHPPADPFSFSSPDDAARLMTDVLNKMHLDAAGLASDRLNIGPVYAAFMQQLFADPQRLFEMQMKLWRDWMALWQDSAKRLQGEDRPALYEPEKGDRRFRAAEWSENPVFDFIKQSYLLTGNWLQDLVKQTEGLDDTSRAKLEFYTRQFVNAMAPSNFPATNPEVLRATIDSNGENLMRGAQKLLDDLRRGNGELKISTTDYTAFTLGENIATTSGRVVYENDLMQLIQYAPSTAQSFARPLLIIPPWINKYYILDLKADNSFVRFCVEQGHTVFLISWVNPGPSLGMKTFDDYLTEGIIAALDHIRIATRQEDCNVVGYCLGGTLLAIALSWLRTRGEEKRIASATFLTTLLDFADSGDMKLFTDEAQLKKLEEDMAGRGFLPADYLRKTFSLLRSNDMIWTFVVNNYLLGKEPFPFDLLYWNDDATNMPAAMHSFYLRKCYLENVLRVPGAVSIGGSPIDLTAITTPAYFLSAKDDHIAPWMATYAGAKLLHGAVTFTLAASGHVAGVVNPPMAQKYHFWTGPDTPADPATWLAAAEQQTGSWWPHWAAWLAKFGGEKVAARKPADGIESAPGRYVSTAAE